MSTPSRHDHLIERILTGDLDAESSEARALFLERPDLLAKMNALQSVKDALNHLTSDATEVAAEARSQVTAKDRAMVQAGMQIQTPEANAEPTALPGPGSSSSRWRSAGLVLAAAAAVVAIVTLRPDGEVEPNGGLLGDASRYSMQVKPVEAGQRHSVDVQLSSNQHVWFRVYRPGSEDPVISALSPSADWTPTEAEQAMLDGLGSYEWEFTVMNLGSDIPGTTGRASVEP